MNQVFKTIGSAVALASLAACGGGGDDAGSGPSKYRESDVKNVATLGAIASGMTGDRVGPALSFLGGVLQGLSLDTGGSRSTGTTSCATGGSGSGTLSAVVTKSAVRAGMAVGDQVTYTFANCVFANASFTFNGTVKLTAQTDAVNLNSATYQVGYSAAFTNFSVKAGALTTTLGGSANAVSSLTSGNAASGTFTVPSGQSLTAVISGGAAGPFSLTYGAGTTFAGSDVTSPNSASRKLDGAVSAGASGATAPLTIATPVALTGTLSNAGQFSATSGVLNTKSSDLATSVTFSGTGATVSGDSDRNGSLDLVFQSSWAALTSGQ